MLGYARARLRSGHKVARDELFFVHVQQQGDTQREVFCNGIQKTTDPTIIPGLGGAGNVEVLFHHFQFFETIWRLDDLGAELDGMTITGIPSVYF